MYEPNVARILSELSDTDIVLDIGGWARPFNRANYVMDQQPYDTRGYFKDRALASVRGWYAPPQGGEREWFTRETWIERDLCERTPYPFKDKEIDFVICSHTLEDLRDPIWVCSEMVRVAKRGYIEVPSRLVESSRGVEPNQVGYSHHRWLVDIVGNHVYFTMKYHMIHSHWRFSLPARRVRRMAEAETVQWLFWDGAFTCSEVAHILASEIAEDLEGFVRRTGAYPKWLLTADCFWRQARRVCVRAAGKARRVLAGTLSSGRSGGGGQGSQTVLLKLPRHD